MAKRTEDTQKNRDCLLRIHKVSAIIRLINYMLYSVSLRLKPTNPQGGDDNMNLIHHKLRSRRGASLSIALLLFLVCLAVASVVLAAGTAASGRLSELREADQRYYSVTSAAELVRDLVSSEPVVFEQKKLITTTESTNDDGEVTTHTSVSVQTLDWNTSVLLKKATLKLVFGNYLESVVNTEEAWLLRGADPTEEELETFTITPSNSNALPVNVRAVIKNGDLVFYFSNQTDASDGKVFYLKMTCTPGVPYPSAAEVDPSDTSADTVLKRSVTVTWKKENCIIERTDSSEAATP